MFKKILISSLAVGALALGAPAAQADDVRFGCTFRAVQQQAATGQAYEGAAFGYIVHPGDDDATIRCYIAVNAAPASYTPWSTPNPAGVGATAGRLTYFASATDVVTFHAEYCTSHGCTTHNYETTRIQIPPQEVIDLLISIAEQIDAALAPVWDLLISIAEQIDAALAPVWAALTDIEKTYVDPRVCPILADHEGSYADGLVVIDDEGDVFIDGVLFWDCPVYGS